MEEPLQGKPPRSQDAIRASLESMRKSNKTVPNAGPMIDGYAPGSQIVVATFYNVDLADSFQEMLGRHNIFSDRIGSRRTVKILVDVDDSRESAELFQKHRKQFPDRQPKSVSQRYDYLVFGILIGLAASCVLVEPNKFSLRMNPLIAAVPITFCVLFGLCGHLFDRFRAGYQRTGKLRLGVWEFMILISLPMVCLLIINIVWKSIFGPSV